MYRIDVLVRTRRVNCQMCWCVSVYVCCRIVPRSVFVCENFSLVFVQRAIVVVVAVVVVVVV